MTWTVLRRTRALGRRGARLASGLATLLLALSPTAAGAAIAEHEPNDLPAAATALAPLGTPLAHAFPPAGGGAVATGTLAPGDIDHFAFAVQAGDLVTVSVVSEDEGAFFDPAIALLDGTGTVLARDDDGGPGFLAALRRAASAADVWTVAVTGFGDDDLDGAGHAETGAYRLVVSVTPDPPIAPEPLPDANDTVPGADPLPPGGGVLEAVAPGGVAVASGALGPGDVDYWTVEVPPGRRVSVSVWDEGAGAFADPIVGLFDGTGAPLRGDDDAHPGFLPALADTAAPAGDALVVGVSGFGDDDFDGSGHAESFAYQLVVAVGPDGSGLACDVDGDLFVDRSDIDAIVAARNQPASGADDPRDADGDGTITVYDARACTLACGNPECAPQMLHAGCGLLGIEALVPMAALAARRARRRARRRAAGEEEER